MGRVAAIPQVLSPFDLADLDYPTSALVNMAAQSEPPTDVLLGLGALTIHQPKRRFGSHSAASGRYRHEVLVHIRLAAILDAWSRRVVGCAIGFDARLAIAALKKLLGEWSPGDRAVACTRGAFAADWRATRQTFP